MDVRRSGLWAPDNILQEGVAGKKETTPPIREEKINYFRNFRTTELIFLTGLKVNLQNRASKKSDLMVCS